METTPDNSKVSGGSGATPGVVNVSVTGQRERDTSCFVLQSEVGSGEPGKVVKTHEGPKTHEDEDCRVGL